MLRQCPVARFDQGQNRQDGAFPRRGTPAPGSAYKKCNLIERFFNKLKQLRHICTRLDRLALIRRVFRRYDRLA